MPQRQDLVEAILIAPNSSLARVRMGVIDDTCTTWTAPNANPRGASLNEEYKVQLLLVST